MGVVIHREKCYRGKRDKEMRKSGDERRIYAKRERERERGKTKK